MDEHIHYELNSLSKILRIFPDTISRFRNDEKVTFEAVRNSFVEAIGIHIRILDHFFFGKPRHDNDLVAADYFDNPSEWQNASRQLRENKEIIRINKRVSKEIVHLSIDRTDVKPEEKDWGKDWNIACKYFNKTLKLFLEIVPESSLGIRLLREKSSLSSIQDNN
ncbi:MAG: hypothetical protein ABIJ45_08290 [Candidatus Zixiibacteriota bacterium]